MIPDRNATVLGGAARTPQTRLSRGLTPESSDMQTDSVGVFSHCENVAIRPTILLYIGSVSGYVLF